MIRLHGILVISYPFGTEADDEYRTFMGKLAKGKVNCLKSQYPSTLAMENHPRES